MRRLESDGILDTAHRVRFECGQIFRYAVATGRAERDPSADLKGALPPVKNGHHAAAPTDPKSVAPLLRAIDEFTGSFVVKCAMQLAPILFVRPGELRHAEWSEIDLEVRNMKSTFKLLLLMSCILLLPTSVLAGEISLSVAASLKEVINELSDNFAKKNSGVKFLKNYGASGQLAKQIESGAPADVFISANLEWMEYLKNKKLVDISSISNFTYNTLVFAGAPGKAATLQDLTKLERVAIGSPKSVPAGEYAMEAFKKAGIYKQLEKKLIMAKDVRECLMYAEREEVDGAFVYLTDALQAKKAKILFTVPQEFYSRVTYPMSLTVSGRQNKDAATFFAYLHGDEAKSTLTKYGFAIR